MSKQNKTQQNMSLEHCHLRHQHLSTTPEQINMTSVCKACPNKLTCRLQWIYSLSTTTFAIFVLCETQIWHFKCSMRTSEPAHTELLPQAKAHTRSSRRDFANKLIFKQEKGLHVCCHAASFRFLKYRTSKEYCTIMLRLTVKTRPSAWHLSERKRACS